MSFRVIPNVINRREAILLAGITDRYVVQRGKRAIEPERKAAVYHPMPGVLEGKETKLIVSTVRRGIEKLADHYSFKPEESNKEWVQRCMDSMIFEFAHYEKGDWFHPHADTDYFGDFPVLSMSVPLTLPNLGGALCIQGRHVQYQLTTGLIWPSTTRYEIDTVEGGTLRMLNILFYSSPGKIKK